MKPPPPSRSSSSKKGGVRSATSFCNLPLLLLIGAIQFLVIYSPAIDRYMVMVTKGKPGFPSLLLDGRRGFKLVEEETIPPPQIDCDFTDPRSDVCELQGAIRIRGSTSEIFIITPSSSTSPPNITGLLPGMNATAWTIQPYTRKGELRVMRSITTLTVRVVGPTDDEAPACTVHHGDVPAVVYSNGGYCGNYYHDFNDNIIPLFVTSRHLGGEVQLLVAQKQAWWFHKYRHIVDGLTNYAAVDLGGGDGDGDGDEVRCFRRATLGLRSHKDLSIDPRRAPRNLSMVDFKRFLMWRYALPREHAIRTDDEEFAGAGEEEGRRRKKPRLLVVTRRARRRFVNLPEIVALAEEVGFEVTASDLMTPPTSPEKKKKGEEDGDGGQSRMAEASAEVNSYDVMVAVHGSGLTNLVFLPMNAVVVQVVPLGRMEGLAMDEYGVPPKDMNMRYLQYNITADESTLSEVYPRAHPVMMDPGPIHEQSWSLVKDVYLGQQDVRINVKRFRPVLVKAMQLLR